MSEPINSKPLCKSIVKKAYTKDCEHCKTEFTSTVVYAKYCKDAECHRQVMNLNSERNRLRRIPKKRAPTKGVKIRKEEKAVPIAQRWLSVPMRKP